MTKGLTGWVAVFKEGRHPGSGELAKHTFSRDDLDQMVGNLSATNPIPHVITHESLYSPFAYAQGVEAKHEEGVLFVRSEKINSDFEELIKTGALFERSVRVVKDKVKGWCLDHIAWLGAEPPAVSGLSPVDFAKPADAFVDFQFIDTQTPFSLKRLARQMREFLVDKFDIETADSVVPEHEIENMEWGVERVNKAHEDSYTEDKEAERLPAHFNKDTSGGDSVKPTKEQLDAAKAAGRKEAEADYKKQLAGQAADFAKEKQSQVKEQWDGKVSVLVDEGRLTPAQAEGVAAFAAQLSDDTEADVTVSFSRAGAEGKKPTEVKVSQAEWFGDFVASLPVQVAMKGSATGSADTSGDDDLPDVEDATAIAEKAALFQKSQLEKGITVSVSEAVSHVTTAKGGE